MQSEEAPNKKLTDSLGIEWVYIPGGAFEMGDTSERFDELSFLSDPGDGSLVAEFADGSTILISVDVDGTRRTQFATTGAVGNDPEIVRLVNSLSDTSTSEDRRQILERINGQIP